MASVTPQGLCHWGSSFLGRNWPILPVLVSAALDPILILFAIITASQFWCELGMWLQIWQDQVVRWSDLVSMGQLHLSWWVKHEHENILSIFQVSCLQLHPVEVSMRSLSSLLFSFTEADLRATAVSLDLKSTFGNTLKYCQDTCSLLAP